MSQYLESYLEDIYNEGVILDVKNFFKRGAIIIEDITTAHKVVFKIENINDDDSVDLLKIGEIFRGVVSIERTKKTFQKEMSKLRKPKLKELQLIKDSI